MNNSCPGKPALNRLSTGWVFCCSSKTRGHFPCWKWAGSEPSLRHPLYKRVPLWHRIAQPVSRRPGDAEACWLAAFLASIDPIGEASATATPNTFSSWLLARMSVHTAQNRPFAKFANLRVERNLLRRLIGEMFVLVIGKKHLWWTVFHSWRFCSAIGFDMNLFRCRNYAGESVWMLQCYKCKYGIDNCSNATSVWNWVRCDLCGWSM